jgi:hypothetical protein
MSETAGLTQRLKPLLNLKCAGAVWVPELTAGTTYFYALRGEDEAGEGAQQACHAWLKTHPAHGDTGPLRFWALGDSGSGNSFQELTFRAYRTFVGEETHTPQPLQPTTLAAAAVAASLTLPPSPPQARGRRT